MPMPENIRFEKWYIFPQGRWDSGMTSDIVMSIGRNGAPLAGSVKPTGVKMGVKNRLMRV